MTDWQVTPASIPNATERVMQLMEFMGEQGEREAVVEWLLAAGDKLPRSGAWRVYYEIAEIIETGQHRAQGIDTRKGGDEGSVHESPVPKECASTAASTLSQHGHNRRREKVRAKTREMRERLGLAPSSALL